MLLHQRVLATLKDLKMIKQSSTILLGVSGGVDSIVMAKIMSEIQHDLGVRLKIVHFNHRLRKNSLLEERFVDKFSKALNIPLIVGRRLGKKIIKKISEAEARTLRFNFFAKVMQELKADHLFLAHNQNDIAETVLMRLIRGSGMQGVRGILRVNVVDQMSIIRPLIDFTREEILHYAKLRNLKYCHDETNDEVFYLRNKIRKELIPILTKEYNPKIIQSLAHIAQTVSDDYDLLMQVTLHRLKENIVISRSRVKIKLLYLRNSPKAIIRLSLRLAYKELVGNLDKIGFDHIESAHDLILSKSDTRIISWPNDIKVKKQKLFVEFYR